MQDAKELLPIVTYHPQWMIAGAVFILTVFVWITWVFWTTRRRKVRTVATIGPKPLIEKDIAALKKKYLALIDEIVEQATARQLTDRQAHQKLSLTVRLFAYEVSGFRAQVMTLDDIKRSRYPALGDIITTYYPNEFAAVAKGTVGEAAQQARQVVSSW